jgi:AcrR family transcriptional regulator
MAAEALGSDRRAHLVSVAVRLFRDCGYHAVGIDKILAESGVAKRTLYLHFRSKDELIVAALAERDQEWREWFRESVKRRSATAEGRLLAVFDALEEWFGRADFNGCMFINAAAEFPKVSSPIHREVARHKGLVREYVVDLAEGAGARDPGALADGICLLMEGAIVMAQVTGSASAARQARGAAGALVAAGVEGRGAAGGSAGRGTR